MDTQAALKMLQDRWWELRGEYDSITEWKQKENIEYSIESLSRVLKRGQIPVFAFALKLAQHLKMTPEQIKELCYLYEEPLFASLVVESDIPAPELMLAKRIMNLPPRKRKLVHDLIEVLES